MKPLARLAELLAAADPVRPVLPCLRHDYRVRVYAERFAAIRPDLLIDPRSPRRTLFTDEPLLPERTGDACVWPGCARRAEDDKLCGLCASHRRQRTRAGFTQDLFSSTQMLSPTCRRCGTVRVKRSKRLRCPTCDRVTARAYMRRVRATRAS